ERRQVRIRQMSECELDSRAGSALVHATSPTSVVMRRPRRIANIARLRPRTRIHLRSAILTNPHSNRNRRHLPALRAQLAKHPEIRHIETPSLDALPGAVDALLEDGVELLAINGGDGTVHLTLTALLHAAGERMPTIALLPGGATSMSARGINGG